jgi:hypothetical protein
MALLEAFQPPEARQDGVRARHDAPFIQEIARKAQRFGVNTANTG